MLDADEYAAFEQWKMEKLTRHPDLSVEAFNAEMSGMADAYDEALKEACQSDLQKLHSLQSANPYRQPGMRGHTPHASIQARPHPAFDEFTADPTYLSN